MKDVDRSGESRSANRRARGSEGDNGQPPGVRRPWRTVTVLALIAAAALGTPVLYDEWVSAHLEAGAAQDLGGPAPMPWDQGDVSDLCESHCPARGDAALGVSLTVLSSRELNESARREMLGEAQRHLTAALRVRPTAGGWWTWLAYARQLDGADQGQVIDALIKSYAGAPFLAQEGPWRVRQCAINWPLLPKAVKERVIDEVVWMRDVDPDNATAVEGAFTDPAALVALRAGLARPAALLVPHRRSGGPGRVGATG